LKIAIVVAAAGVPTSLASTAFVGALLEGLDRAGAIARVIGLTQSKENWRPELIGSTQVDAPWLGIPEPRSSDVVRSMKSGVFDDGPCGNDEWSTWYLEWLFERCLREFAGDDTDGVVMVYPRSYWLFRLASRVAARVGWRVVSFATEALTDAQVDPVTRDAYIRCVVSQARGVWAVSGHLASFWRQQGVPSESILVSPSIVRASSFEQRAAPSRAGHAVFVGNLVHRDVDNLLDVARLVHAREARFRLSMYGDAAAPELQRLEERIEELGLAGVVRVFAPVAPTEIPRVLATADILLLPRAKGEFSDAGFPNKLGEYLASGRPVVVTGVGEIPLHLVDERDALIVQPEDCPAFASAVLRILRDEALGDRLGRSGRDLATSFAKSDAVARRALGFLQSLPESGSGTPETTSKWVRALRALRVLDLTPGLKRSAVRTLRRMGLKNPAPGSESHR